MGSETGFFKPRSRSAAAENRSKCNAPASIKSGFLEIGIQRVQVNTTAYDPGTFEEVTARDDAKVQHRLGRELRSFRYLN
jgi:hypothetical protein